MTQLWPPEDDDQRDVFILGAGFSRAISDLMPLTDELGNLCRDRLVSEGARASRFPEFRSGGFETWLTQLAEDQPYLGAAENLENKALFERISAKIGEILTDLGLKLLHDPCPDWLADLVLLWHLRRAALVSFNYDLLVESVVSSGVLYDWRALPKTVPDGPVYWSRVIDDVPSIPPGYARSAPSPAETLSLLKLHGSLNWFWGPGDETGGSFCHLDTLGGFGFPSNRDGLGQTRTAAAPGRVPFIVPPSALKSSYYRNPITRHVWQTARERLRYSRRVVLIGYSFPPTDLGFGALFRDAFDPDSAALQIVDPQAENVLGSIRASLQLDDLAADDEHSTVEAFVISERRREAAGAAAYARNALEGNEKLAVAWNDKSAAPVTAVQRASTDRVRLTIGTVVGLTTVMNRAGIPVSAEPESASVLIQALNPGDVIEVDLANGRTELIVGIAAHARSDDSHTEPWVILIPTGVAPEPDAPGQA